MTTYATIEPEATELRGVAEKRGGKKPDMPERLLWKLWKRRAARQAEFRTGTGKRVRVLYPGRSGTSAGPDFRDALLDVEGLGLVRGDVEIHRRQRDWDSHGHGDDPNYSGVVLHGALDVDDPETALHSGGSAQVVSLSQLLDGSVDVPADGADGTGPDNHADDEVTSGLWELLARHGYTRPPDAAEAGALLDRAGDERFRRKAATLGRFAAEQGPEQAMYEALMEGLGYRHNQQPFVKLAQAAPFEALRRATLPILAEQRPMVLRHWLMAVSGLSENGEAAKHLPGGVGPAMERKEWHLFRVRPSNHPSARAEGAAVLVARFIEPGLVQGLVEASTSPRQLVAALAVESGKGGTAPIGAGRARDLSVNAVLPLLHSMEGGAESGYLDLFRSFPKLQGNEVVREMTEQLLPEDWRSAVNCSRRQQGLLHLAALLRGAT